jgi:hypothetical protein
MWDIVGMQMDTGSLRLRPLPRPTRPTYERRSKRSLNAADALEFALTNSARRGALDAVLIVDDAGMIVAQSATDLDLSMLAAVTPIVGRGKAIPKIKRNGEPRELSITPIELHDELLYLAVLGGTRRTRTREMAGSQAAATRILA